MVWRPDYRTLVEPDSSSLAKRDFDFRLSTATVIMNTVEFSDFTGYQRILMSLDNPVRLAIRFLD